MSHIFRSIPIVGSLFGGGSTPAPAAPAPIQTQTPAPPSDAATRAQQQKQEVKGAALAGAAEGMNAGMPAPMLKKKNTTAAAQALLGE